MINFFIVGTQRRNQIGDKNIIEELICSKLKKIYKKIKMFECTILKAIAMVPDYFASLAAFVFFDVLLYASCEVIFFPYLGFLYI